MKFENIEKLASEIAEEVIIEYTKVDVLTPQEAFTLYAFVENIVKTKLEKEFKVEDITA